MESGFFVYLSTIEGLLIVCMLGWEVFWLRRMYQALQNMPTTDQMGNMVKQLSEMVKSVNEGKRVVENTFNTISALIPFSGMFGLLGGNKTAEPDKKG
jgi:hypothetical protein